MFLEFIELVEKSGSTIPRGKVGLNPSFYSWRTSTYPPLILFLNKGGGGLIVLNAYFVGYIRLG